MPDLITSTTVDNFMQSANASAARNAIGAAPIDSPALTGTPTAPTAAPGTSTTQVATTAFVAAALGDFAPYPEVANFAALPTASTHSGETYVAIAAQGVYFVNRKPAGLYRSDGSSWVYLADATEAYFQDTLAWSNITSKPSSFTPSTHASSHAAAGSDPLTLAQSQVTNLTTDLAAKAAAADLTSHTSNTSNPHSVTKAQVGLGNCDNTSDLAKPISTATQTALDGKQAAGNYAAASHTHATGEVTGLGELIEDTIGTKVIAGANITVSYNDTTGETTVSASGGGGGGGGGIDAVPVVASIAYNTSVSAAQNTEAIVPLESIVHDPASAWSIGANGGLIAPAAGTYELSAIVIRANTNNIGERPSFGFSTHGGSTRTRTPFARSEYPSNDPFHFSRPQDIITVTAGQEIELKLTSFDLSFGNYPAVSMTTHWQGSKSYMMAKRIR